MSDGLTPDQIRRREKAFERANAIVPLPAGEMAELYQDGGAEAVAEAACNPGGPSKEQIAADYERWVQEALAARQQASGLQT